jgi:serine/threonine protein phosphatase PrpC
VSGETRAGRMSALSDTGRRRLQNEDAYVCDPPLFAVADGMGGHHAGEVASRLAAAALEDREHGLHGEAAVAELIDAANERIYHAALADPSAAGMGTTVTAALVDDRDGTIAIGHVGDSRAYLVRDGTLEQLTSDHSLVAELLRSGRLTEEEAQRHPQRSVITRAAGTEPTVEVDTATFETRPGDLYVLCSDGLTTMIDDRQILEIVQSEAGDPERVADALVAAANRAGGEDNITVVVFEIVPAGHEPGAAEADAPTAESVLDTAGDAPLAPIPAELPVRRHGAGRGGRALAVLAILVAVAVAIALVWLGLR